MIQAKAKIGDKVKIMSENELRSLYDENDFHQNSTLQSLLWLRKQCVTGIVRDVTWVGEELIEYKVEFPNLVESISLYDSDFYVIKELYKEVPVYLCVDLQGGMCDRLCFGTQALIKNANASIDTWNDLQDEEHHEYVDNVQNAINVLTTDNFEVIQVQPNSVYMAENFIVTDCDIHDVRNFGEEDKRYIHKPKWIWELLQKGIYERYVVDLTVDTKEDVNVLCK